MRWLVFDIDGVLIDVSKSFDKAVKKTVKYILEDQKKESTSPRIKEIRELRKKGVFGDDFKLTEALILGLERFGSFESVLKNFHEGENIEWVRERWSSPDAGQTENGNIDRDQLKRVFDSFYLGDELRGNIFEFKGLWKEEKSMVKTSLLERAEKRYDIGVVTGRNDKELELAENIIGYEFDRCVTRDSFLKPDPRALKELVGDDHGVYIGDTLTDQKMIERYDEKYEGDFEFVMIERDVKGVNTFLKDILGYI